jgi:endonuclease/exonuclease/phosphatase (EEP) superfamily protein YafD
VVRSAGPQLDVLAVVLPAVAAAGIVLAAAVAVVGRRTTSLAVVASLTVFTVVAVLAPRTPRPTADPVDAFLLVSANTFNGNRTPEAAVRALADRHADVVVAVEATKRIRRLLPSVLDGYASRTLGPQAVYARWPLGPLVELPGVPSSAGFRVTVKRPGAPFDLVALHLPNPLHETSFTEHLAMVERLIEDVRGSARPVIVAGDLNMSDRTNAYRALTGSMRDAMRSGWAGTTYGGGLFRLLQLRIDHVFEPGTWCSTAATTFDVPGSDHRGLSVRLGACPS